MYNDSKKITSNEAKKMLANKSVVLVNDSDIGAYTNGINYYNSGVYGWNYSVAYNARLCKWVICGYRVPKSIFLMSRRKSSR